MSWRPQINDRGVIVRFSNSDTGEVITTQEYERRMQMLQGGYTPSDSQPGISSGPAVGTLTNPYSNGYPPVSPGTNGSNQSSMPYSGQAMPFAPPDDPAL